MRLLHHLRPGSSHRSGSLFGGRDPRKASQNQVGTVRGLGTILALWAHPDDETYLAGGLMSLAARAGRRVVSISATAGEQGGEGDRRALAARRRRELRDALHVLGVHEHAVLDYPDGGCHHVDLAAGVAAFAAAVDTVRPDTIVTFGPDGMTGHPDHRAVSAWATSAWLEVRPSARLLYATTAPHFVERHRAVHETIDAFAPGLPSPTPVDELALRLTLDDRTLARKVAALRRHHSQTRVVETAIGTEAFTRWWDEECFVDATRVLTADEPLGHGYSRSRPGGGAHASSIVASRTG